MIQRSFDNSPSLYLIPTPIGNIDDITVRSLNTLKMVDEILCEDTRDTGLLLHKYNIKKKLTSCHEYNEKDIIDYVAFVPALTSSGIEPSPFLYYGFLNSKSGKQIQELTSLKDIKFTIIFYEAVHRLKKTLSNILDVFGDRNICLCRELTKIYEEYIRGRISEIIPIVDDLKGEFVIVVEGNKEVIDYSNLDIVDHVKMYLDEMSEMKAIKQVAKERRVAKSIIYNEYHKRK